MFPRYAVSEMDGIGELEDTAVVGHKPVYFFFHIGHLRIYST